MPDCLFCKIAHKEIPSEVIYEDDGSLAFLDIHPLSPGHTVIIPKIHAENMLDLSDEMVAPLFISVKRVISKLQEKLAPRGFTIGINHGKVSGQSVDHIHVHVIPRYAGDGGGSLHSVVNFQTSENVKSIAKKIIN